MEFVILKGLCFTKRSTAVGSIEGSLCCISLLIVGSFPIVHFTGVILIVS